MKREKTGDTMEQKKISIQASVMWNSIGSIFYLGCQWLLTVLVVRIAGIDTAGTLSLAMSVCNIWYCISVYGMRNFQVSDTQDKYGNGTYIFSRYLTCAAALLGCVIYITVVGYDPEQKLCILLYFLFKFSEALYDVYAGIFQKEWRLDYAGKSMLVRGVLSIGAFTGLLLVTSLPVAIAGMAAVCLAEVLLWDLFHARKIADTKPDWNVKKVMALLKECFPLLAYTLLSSVIGTIPRLFMERILGNYELGIYGSVATPTLIIQMAATYVFNPFVTLFAERYYQKDKKQFMRAFLNCTLAVAAISLVGIIGGKIFGEWGLNLLYGEEIAAHVELLIPLIICTILTAFSWLLCGILTAIREFKGLVVGNLLAVIVSTALSAPCESRFGMQGASLALAAAVVVEIVILLIFMMKKTKKQFQ